MHNHILKICISAGVALLAAAPGWTKPIYLECSFEGDGASKVTIDEDTGKVQYQVISNGKSWIYPAVFTDTTVSFTTALGVETISRVDLSVVLATGPDPYRGQCKIAPQVDRKF